MRSFYFLLFFAIICVIVSADTQDMPANEVDPNMIRMILDAIESNRNKIDSFEAIFTRKTTTTFIIDGEHQKRDQTVTVRHWSEKEGGKWRSETEMVLPVVRDGMRYYIPHKTSASYDGKETRYLHERHSVGEIDDGNVVKDNSGIVNKANRFSGRDIMERISQADSIETVMLNGKQLILITAINPEYNFTRKIWLNPAKGYNIERAEFWAGEVLGELQVSEIISKFGNAWIVTDMRIEQYSEEREILHQDFLHVNVVNYGKPISEKVFNLEFPPETYVTDNIEGKEYQVPYSFGSFGDNQARWSNVQIIVWVFCNIVFLGILVCLYFLRRKSQQNH